MIKTVQKHTITPNPKAPQLWEKCRVGLMGGSFDPAHKGHLHLAVQALYKLDLDYIWWLFTPQNPLKSPLNTPDIQERIYFAKQNFHHPKMIFSNLEASFGTRYSYETIKETKKHFPKTDFVWIAGMDNTRHFHKWERWQDLMQEIPIVLFPRPPLSETSQKSVFKEYQSVFKHYSSSKELLPGHIYWVLSGPTINISSTQLRESLP